MAKKVNKKEIEKTVETVEIEKKEIESTEIEATISEIEETMNSVSAEIITGESLLDVEKTTEEVLTPLITIQEKMNDLDISAEKINEQLTNSPKEEIEEFIKEEIKKVESIKKDIDKLNKKCNTFSSSQMTNWWNGMGYDM